MNRGGNEPATPAEDGTPGLWLEGVCHALFAFEVGQRIDLDACRSLFPAAAEPAGLDLTRPAPAYFQFDPPPLRVSRAIEPTDPIPPIEVSASATVAPRPSVEFVLYDFGAVSLSYRIPFAGDLESLVELSAGLDRSSRLAADAQRRIEGLLAAIAAAVTEPALATVREDYVVFEVERSDPPVDGGSGPERHAADLARILRAERGPLSAQEVSDATTAYLAYGGDDLTLVDWQAALLFDRDAGDVRAVLEFANVQLLEMRFLDHALDRALDRAYLAFASERRRRLIGLGALRLDLRAVARMQVDAAVLFEQVHNALKLTGDPYLARVYRAITQRLRLGEWNQSILRKLETLESIYRKVADRAQSHRAEALEWIIIVLIAAEIALSILGR